MTYLESMLENKVTTESLHALVYLRASGQLSTDIENANLISTEKH
jgi:hypothetical protein